MYDGDSGGTLLDHKGCKVENIRIFVIAWPMSGRTYDLRMLSGILVSLGDTKNRVYGEISRNVT